MIAPPFEVSRTAVALIARLPWRKMLQITVKTWENCYRAIGIVLMALC